MLKFGTRTYPVMLLIVNDDFYESKSERYPLQGVNIGNERKRAVTRNNFYLLSFLPPFLFA